MSHHYLVVSDLHLSDIEDNADGWKAYKGTRFVFDDDIAELLRRFSVKHRGEADSLVASAQRRHLINLGGLWG
jgi:hypothetical protein